MFATLTSKGPLTLPKMTLADAAESIHEDDRDRAGMARHASDTAGGQARP